MIRHIFKIIWNERKTNFWIVTEYVIVFCILWFCFDYMYFIGKAYHEPLGFDLNNTYSISMTKKSPKEYPPGYEIERPTMEDEYSYVMTLIERLKRYPGVENVGISFGSMPFSRLYMRVDYAINADTVVQHMRMRNVSSEFFDVFRIKIDNGEIFDWTDPASKDQVLISPDRNGFFGDPKKSAHLISEVRKLGREINSDSKIDIIGITKKIKSSPFEPYNNTIFYPLTKSETNMSCEITIRIHPNATKGFEERFAEDMKEQLNIGPYKLSRISSLKQEQKNYLTTIEIIHLNGVYSITLFLIINVFLGVIGTFWYRTESRRSEIGLRIALGSSKRKIKSFLYSETIFLLLISAFIGVNICINIGQTDILTAIGIPKADPIVIGSGVEQYFINFGLTFLFLAAISILAVWYPTRQTSNLHPADVLHEE